MAKIRIKQVRSIIKRPKNQKRTMEAFGLGKINREVELEDSPQVRGMLRRVTHLVAYEVI